MADVAPETIPLDCLADAAAESAALSREEENRRRARAAAERRHPPDLSAGRPRRAVGGTAGSGAAGAARPQPQRHRHPDGHPVEAPRPMRTPERRRRGVPHCPSAQAWQEGAFAFGVVGGKVGEPQVGYLEGRVPVSDELLALSGPVKPTEVFRFAAPCNSTPCRHFNGHDCNLVAKLVQLMPPVSKTLPACKLRPDCRWWLQVGKSACFRCPAIKTDCYAPGEGQRVAADHRIPVPGTVSP